MNAITDRQKQICGIVEAYWDREGVAPSMQDIADALGTSKQNAYNHVHALVRKGCLIMNLNMPRSIRIKK